MFHWRNGIYFGRKQDGSVRLIVRSASDVFPDPNHSESYPDASLDVTIPAAEWASITSSVSKSGETSESYEAAKALHG